MKWSVILSIFIGLTALVFAGWQYVTYRNRELEFEIRLLQKDTQEVLELCERVVRSIERRQRSLEDIVMTVNNLWTVQRRIHAYNVRMGVRISPRK